MIGELFGKAWELYKKDLLWLILAGLVAGVIVGGLMAIGVGAMMAAMASAFLGGLAKTDSSTTTTLSVGGMAGGFVVYLLCLIAAQVLGMVFYGGLFEMVIGADREARAVRFDDLFSGFQRFTSYLMFALVLFGVSFGLSLLNLIPVIGALISLCVGIWLSVIWLYVLPLIADQRLSFGDAARRSKDMVSSVGWWSTFGLVVLLYVALIVIAIVLGVISLGVYRGSETGGLVIGAVLFIAFAVLAGPFVICYIAAMYMGSSWASARPALPFGVPEPPAPPAGGYGGYQPTAPPTASAVAPASADAWKAAADPLAGPMVQSLHAPARPATSPAAGPQPPAPPAPPAPEPPA